MRLNCREVMRKVSQGEDRSLAFGERVALRLHFTICSGCRSASRQLRFLRLAVRELARERADEAAG